MPLVQHVGHAAAHACGEVLPRGPQDDHLAPGHVFAAVAAHALHHGGGAGVTDAEALSRHTVDKRLAAGGAIEVRVARDDMLPGLEGAVPRRIENQLPAGEALA